MLNELPKRYKFVRCSHIPATECNGANFRSNLLSLLYCEPMESSYNIALYQLSAHFNGDISKHDEWVHYCQGPDCCRNLQHSLNKAGLLQGALKPDKLFHGISHGGTSRIQSGLDKLVSIVGLNKEVYRDYAAKGLLISVFRFNQWGWKFLQQVLYILNIYNISK